MKSRVLFGSFIVFSILALSVFAIAQTDETQETRRNDFDARLSHIKCRVDLTNSQIDMLLPVDPALTMHKEKLQADMTKLMDFSDNTNEKEFSSYFTTTFKENLRNAVIDIREAKMGIRRSNLTSSERMAVRDNNKAAVAEFADCINEADKEIVENRVEHLNSWVAKWTRIINSMNGKGYETSEMQVVVDDAETKLIPALDAIKNATNKDLRKAAMEDARNLHLHLWARFEIARVSSYLDFITDDAVAKGHQTDVDAINAKLDEASALAVSGKRYRDGEFETVWSAIREAVRMLKELNRKVAA